MTTLFFDLDGTILGMDDKEFNEQYFKGLGETMAHLVEPKLTKKAVYQSFIAMIDQINTKTNKEKFFESYYQLTGIDESTLSTLVAPYYQERYQQLRQYTWPVESVIEAVKYLKQRGYQLILATNPVFPAVALKQRGYQLILATNPVFPAVATHQRVQWTGLKVEDFLTVTTYEDQYACKPNKEYFAQLTEKYDLDPKDCWMIGNDAQEDMIASELGFRTVLLTDNLIDRNTKSYTCQKMTSQEFVQFVYANF